MIEGEGRLDSTRKSSRLLTYLLRLKMHAPYYCPVIKKGKTPSEESSSVSERKLS
jgi:hypothetical protein